MWSGEILCRFLDSCLPFRISRLFFIHSQKNYQWEKKRWIMFLNIHKKKLVKIKKFPWWRSVLCRKHHVKLNCSPQVMVRAWREHMCTISTLVTLIPKIGENYTNNFTYTMFSAGTTSTPLPRIFSPTFFFLNHV